MLLAEFIRDSVSQLEKIYPSPEARGMVLMVCEEKLGVKSYTHVIEPLTPVPEDRLDELSGCVARLLRNEPVQYVLGFGEFCGRRFRVAPGVLIPRPETEELATMALEALRSCGPGARAVDLCTGSGCIAWTLKLGAPDCDVLAVDLSDDALGIAASQNFSPSPSFIRADVLDPDCLADCGTFDVLVSNPPYVMECEKSQMRANVLDYEPSMALFVPDDDPLVFYRALSALAGRLLKPSGRGFLEINESLPDRTLSLFEASGFSDCRIIDDFRGRKRFVSFEKPAL